MALTKEEVAHIAELAHLALSDEALAQYQEQLSTVLQYIEQIQALDTDAIPPTATVLPLRSVLREDEPGEVLPRSEALSNAPEAEVDCFFVPPVMVKE